MNLDYSQDFAIFPFAFEDSIDDSFPPKNDDDKNMIELKSQEYDTNAKGKYLTKIFTKGSRKDPRLHKNNQANDDEFCSCIMCCS
jgi:hypothetical protein